MKEGKRESVGRSEGLIFVLDALLDQKVTPLSHVLAVVLKILLVVGGLKREIFGKGITHDDDGVFVEGVHAVVRPIG